MGVKGTPKMRHVNEHSRETKEIQACRKALGLSPRVIKIRNCLKCDMPFKSRGNWNRVCDTCAIVNNRTANLDYCYFSSGRKKSSDGVGT